MDRSAYPQAELDAADGGLALPAEDEGQAGREGGSLHLTLDGFSGPLETLLTLARGEKIDLSRISLTALVDHLVAALRQRSAKIPLGQKGDWMVMAAWLVQAVDVVEFLWASLALFDEPKQPDTATRYRPRPFAPYPVAAARDRILRLLGDAPDWAPLERFLPDVAEHADDESRQTLRRRSAWSSTLIAGLELAKQGDVVLAQGEDFEAIHVART